MGTPESRERWRFWGPYVSARSWGTVREDYSAGGDAWGYFPFEDASRRAYRWSEDGLFGICDRYQHLCFAVALWNRHDERLKERLFGLSNPQGNHGEDVKEAYHYLENLPSHAYMRALYRYPQRAFPYEQLVAENARRSREEPEYELADTGIFADNAYFDVTFEYAKAEPEDILIGITVENRGTEAADLEILPTLWFRNDWSWEPVAARPSLDLAGPGAVRAVHPLMRSPYTLHADGASEAVFTENESDLAALFGVADPSPYVKDGIERCVVRGERDAVNPAMRGTKAALRYALHIEAGSRAMVRLRLVAGAHQDPFADFDSLIEARRSEARAFYDGIFPPTVDDSERAVGTQALAGILWSKQHYHFDVDRWLRGDPLQPAPPPERLQGRNSRWRHLNSREILAMPDTWEYPWFAAWDTAFQTIPIAMVDPALAKAQLIVLCREWFMSPTGQLPAYEWNFGDVNPPVHAWAALRVFEIDARRTGKPDTVFLERIFQKLLLNFTWWVNRRDRGGNNVFQGGFLGLDNVGLFDRSKPLATGAFLDQSDGTSWMAFFALGMLAIALRLAHGNAAYEDMATKFFEHFVAIATAINDAENGLWDEDDGFYYDVLHTDGRRIPLRVQSVVGIIPLLACAVLEQETLDALPGFRKRLEWFVRHHQESRLCIASPIVPGIEGRRLLAVVEPQRLQRILATLFDERSLLSPHGIRSLSKRYGATPYHLAVDGQRFQIDYEPAESRSGLFGGNSNWRGPVWFPINYLVVEALQRYHYYLGDAVRVELPTGSGRFCTLWEAAAEISRRLVSLWLPGNGGRIPAYGQDGRAPADPFGGAAHFYYEYFNGDDGTGLGASHQTGWTALVAKLVQQRAEYATGKRPAGKESSAV